MMFAKLFRYTNLSLQIYLWIINQIRQKFYVSLVKNYNPLLSHPPFDYLLKCKVWEFYDAIES